MAAIGPVPFGLQRIIDQYRNNVSPANFSLNSSTDYAAFIFSVDAAAPLITKVAIRQGTLNGSAPDYLVSLQGVDGSGLPDGTVKGGGSPASVTWTPAGADDGKIKWLTLSNSYQTTAGEMLALNVMYTGSKTIDGSNYVSVSTDNNFFIQNLPYSIRYDSAGPTTTRRQGAIFGYASASVVYGWPYETSSYFSPGSSPVYAGSKFTLPAGIGDTVSCVGLWFCNYGTTGKAFRFTLYDNSDNVLASTDLDCDHTETVTRHASCFVYWDDGAISLTCGSTYRLVMTFADGSASGRLYYYAMSVNADLDAQAWQDIFIGTSGSAGSWTDYDTRMPFIGPLIADITEPSGGSGGAVVAMPSSLIGAGVL